MIAIKGLKKNYDELAILKGIDLHIDKGTIFGIAGRSGTGKSTLLRCINGLEAFNEGMLKVDGVDVKSLSKKDTLQYRKEIGMIFQHFSLLNRLTVYENIALPMKCWNYSKEAIDKRVKELLEMVGLSDKIDAKTKELSGGQKQRVAIARALAMEPKILLCDEATSALDPKSTQEVLNLLKTINQTYGITMVVVTHEMSVLRSICEKVAILENGMVEVVGTVESIFQDKPQALKNLLGDEQRVLPSTGDNIEILFSHTNYEIPIIAHAARDIGVSCRIVGGDLENDSLCGPSSLIVNIPSSESQSLTNYLTSKGFLWREIEGNRGNLNA